MTSYEKIELFLAFLGVFAFGFGLPFLAFHVYKENEKENYKKLVNNYLQHEKEKK